MRLSVAFSGPAGAGINTPGLLLSQLLADKWYIIYADKEYASVIKWDNNLYVIYISDDRNYISKNIDIFMHIDDYSVTKNEKIYNLKRKIKVINKGKNTNIISLWLVLKILNIPLQQGEDYLTKKYGTKAYFPDMIKSLEEWFNISEKSQKFDFSQKAGEPKKLFYWNELIAKGALKSWLDFYSFYPMTPASTIATVIIQKQDNYPKLKIFQGEDEIAVSMAMLGANFAWSRAMCATSGWWFALMTESVWFANQTEIGWVYILSQRDGPSTGTPTFTSQWDLDFALNSSFWETKPIVLIPSSLDEWYSMIGKALNYAKIYQHPIIVMLDKQFSESYISFEDKYLKHTEIDLGLLESEPKEFTRYKNTKSGISPYSVPGMPEGEFMASSYEHDEFWATNEDPSIKWMMTEKRFRKMDTFVKNEFTKENYWFEIINPEAETLFISFGVNTYVLQDYIAKKKDCGVIIIKNLHPLDIRLKKLLEKKPRKKIIFVEHNYSWVLENRVRKECKLYGDQREKTIVHIRKYTLYPFFLEDIHHKDL